MERQGAIPDTDLEARVAHFGHVTMVREVQHTYDIVAFAFPPVSHMPAPEKTSVKGAHSLQE